MTTSKKATRVKVKTIAAEYMANAMGHPNAVIVDHLEGLNDEWMVLFDNEIALVVARFDDTGEYDVSTETDIESFNHAKL